MRGFLALVRRECIEHRGALFIAPMFMLGVFTLLFGFALFTGRLDALFEFLANSGEFAGGNADVARSISLGFAALNARTIIERGTLLLSFGWGLYAIGVAFFYAADAFTADKRNNAMLFWKSMPVSDFEVLLSKFVTAVIVLPVIATLLMALNGLLFAGLLAAVLWSFTTPALIFSDWLSQLGLLLVGLGATAGAISLWYLPIVAWVGGLSVVVGRWSIPLSFLIPTVASLVENLFVNFDLSGGVVWRWLTWRLNFPPIQDGYVGTWVPSTDRFDLVAYLDSLWAILDWTQIGIGLVFALVVLWLASEYRRRRILAG
jgi:ABC-2 type transport system permease protein